MPDRLRITIEFNKKREQDLLLYQELIRYSSPQAVAKDMLLGVLPLPRLGDNVTIEEVE
ncbi:MAG: hypothetical protein ACRDD7_17145 [Peptostreptococcaceae bacterium]